MIRVTGYEIEKTDQPFTNLAARIPNPASSSLTFSSSLLNKKQLVSLLESISQL